MAKRFSDRTICIPVAGAPGAGGATASKAPVPTTTTSPGVIAIPANCGGGRIGTPPNCRCPDGTQWTGRACLTIAAQPPAGQCPPGLTLFQGRCVSPQPIPLDPFSASGVVGGGRRPPNPTCPPDKPVGTYPNCCPAYTVSDGRGGCGGFDTVQKGGTSVPPPGGARVPVPSSVPGQGTLTRGGSGAADALRATQCQPYQVFRNGVCACPVGMTGPRCDQVLVR
jgi:hypothetical protein